MSSWVLPIQSTVNSRLKYTSRGVRDAEMLVTIGIYMYMRMMWATNRRWKKTPLTVDVMEHHTVNFNSAYPKQHTNKHSHTPSLSLSISYERAQNPTHTHSWRSFALEFSNWDFNMLLLFLDCLKTFTLKYTTNAHKSMCWSSKLL